MKPNVYARWVAQRRLSGAPTAVVVSERDEYIAIGNFVTVGAYVKIMRGGDANTQLNFQHAMEPDGLWSDCLGTPLTLDPGSAAELNTSFAADASGNALLRYLRFEVTSSGAFDVTVDISLILKR